MRSETPRRKTKTDEAPTRNTQTMTDEGKEQQTGWQAKRRGEKRKQNEERKQKGRFH